ncbi:tapasin-related protein-like [Oreochromis aureus]|uniref:Ig-like domain-containing protein n=1 Tax=Oreochromis aureus TaxID=47969 RepID=A0A668RB71_OREAU|nr:tapasin-related protein-like [Oreochromis aureus]
MGLMLTIFIYWTLSAGVWSVHQFQWLPCSFIDERVFLNKDNHTETRLIHREAILQFGQKGDAPVNRNAITFLITRSKLDLLQYVEGVEAEQLKCELHRYSTEGGYVRWPVLGAREYNHWFTCILRHSRGLFTITSFLRRPFDQPPPGRPDYQKWPPIPNREVLTTTVAMVIKTQTPSVKARLKFQQKLHCQFDVDHKGAKVTVEWHKQHHGERTKLFSYNRRTEQTQGSGVGLRAFAAGDASYTLASTMISSEGTYICSVSVNPLFARVDINLQIEEPPHVSLNVGPSLSLMEGNKRKIVCEANSYYPRDVEIIWHEQDPVVLGAPHPRSLENVILSYHRENRDMTFSLSGFFYLQAALRDSGKKFTCSVSHQSLKVPITKSFTLIVEEPTNWMLYLAVGSVMILLLYVKRSYLHSAWRKLAGKVI